MVLQHALLRRKELQNKLDRMKTIAIKDLFETKVVRKNVTESVDDVTATVAKLTYSEFNEEWDYYSAQLRKIDAAIQQANWETQCKADESLMLDFSKKA